MFVDTDAIVLRTIPYSETSLISRLFTKDKGKITVMAKGARRKKNPLAGILETSNLIQIQTVWKENREIQILKEASLKLNTLDMRKNLEKLLTAISIVEIMDKTTQPLQASPILFRLLYRVLQQLCLDKYNTNILYWFYLIQLTIQHGFKPEVQVCAKCRSHLLEGIYSKQIGELCCSKCETNHEIILQSDELSFIVELMITHIERLDNLELPKQNLYQISIFLEQFMCHHIEGMSRVRSVNIAHGILH